MGVDMCDECIRHYGFTQRSLTAPSPPLPDNQGSFLVSKVWPLNVICVLEEDLRKIKQGCHESYDIKNHKPRDNFAYERTFLKALLTSLFLRRETAELILG